MFFGISKRSRKRHARTVLLSFSVLIALTCVMASGCHSSTACPGSSCLQEVAASVALPCLGAGLASVNLSGTCDFGDAGNDPAVYVDRSGHIVLGSPVPCTCHVELTFVNGYRYGADIDFVSVTAPTDSCGSCPPYVAPTQTDFTVDEPDAGCMED